MKKFIFLKFLLVFLLAPQLLQAQMVTTIPSSIYENASAQIVFDLSQTALADYASDDVYVHTGIITDKSTSDSDWK